MEELFINCRRDETTFVKKKGAGIHNSPDGSRGEGVGGPGEAVSPTDSVQCEPLRYKERYFVLMFTLWGLFGTDINVTAIKSQERARRFRQVVLEPELRVF